MTRSTRQRRDIVSRLVDLRAGEGGPLVLACLYFFFILCSYYVIRPIRDTMGLAGGVDALPWLFSGTLAGMLVAQPLFAAAVSRLPRRRFIPVTYRFFAANLVLFWLLLRSAPEGWEVWIGRAFFIWTSVFNLFVISVFWGFMADVFRTEQGKRLFAPIGVGGTLGAIAGGLLTTGLVERIGAVQLLLLSALLLEAAVTCARLLGRRTGTAPESATPWSAPREPVPGGKTVERAIGGGALSGVTHVLRSPYMLGICAYMLLFTMGSTFLYFQQAAVIAAATIDTATRTALFAKIDVLVNALTVVTQLFVTGRLMKSVGVGVTLALLPALSVVGFSGLTVAPVLAVVIAFQVLRRAGNFAVARPAREVLFTVLAREDKYKAKSFIDTFVYRGGDQVAAWSWALLGWIGLGVAGVAAVAAPLSGLWLVVSLWLGRRQRSLAAPAV